MKNNSSTKNVKKTWRHWIKCSKRKQRISRRKEENAHLTRISNPTELQPKSDRIENQALIDTKLSKILRKKAKIWKYWWTPAPLNPLSSKSQALRKRSSMKSRLIKPLSGLHKKMWRYLSQCLKRILIDHTLQLVRLRLRRQLSRFSKLWVGIKRKRKLLKRKQYKRILRGRFLRGQRGIFKWTVI